MKIENKPDERNGIRFVNHEPPTVEQVELALNQQGYDVAFGNARLVLQKREAWIMDELQRQVHGEIETRVRAVAVVIARSAIQRVIEQSQPIIEAAVREATAKAFGNWREICGDVRVMAKGDDW